MAVLEFTGYRVNNMKYIRNKNFNKKTESIKMSPEISSNFNVKDDNKIIVSLAVTVGSTEQNSVPFQAECSVSGTFIYKVEEDETKVGLDKLIRNNAVAILYPYVRMIISNLTMNSNEYPNYNLPTINVGKLLQDQNK